LHEIFETEEMGRGETTLSAEQIEELRVLGYID
jgi:hypothetical protein